MNFRSTLFAKSFVVSLALLAAGVAVAATSWSNPPSGTAPTNCTTDSLIPGCNPPLNTGPSLNQKTGPLTILGAITGGTSIGAPQITATTKFCINSDCITDWGSAGGSASQWKDKDDASGSIYYNSGNVGIGSSTPSQKLTVNGGIVSQSGQFLGSTADSATKPSYSWLLDTNSGIYNAATDAVGITTAGVERVRVNANGNVGIGRIAAAAYSLDVSGAGNAGEGSVHAASFLYSSDERLKTNIETIGGALQKILAIRGVSFVWKEGTDKAGKEDIGVIAQEVEKVAPEAVVTGSDGYKTVDYPRLVPLLINAIHDQQAEIGSLKARLDKAGL